MSWSISSLGKAPAVVLDVDKQFSALPKLPDTEVGIVDSIKSLVDTVIAAQDPSMVVQVSLSGDQILTGKAVTSTFISVIVTPISKFAG